MKSAIHLLFFMLLFPVILQAQYTNPFHNLVATTLADTAAKLTIQQLSLKEKIKLIAGNKHFNVKSGLSFVFKGHLAPASMSNHKIPDLPDLTFTDGPRGITTHPQTNFPSPITRASTWNINLENKVGAAMALEAKNDGSSLIGAPCINLLRHPSNGRAQESYGEDSYLVGSFGVALIEGIQSKGVMSCVKHFALNSIEDTRYHVDVKVDDRTLNEVYLPHFKRCIDAGVASVMTAYNKVNGHYCAENQQLGIDILRNTWNFKGFTQSDWNKGIKSTAASVLAQSDLEMPVPKYYTYKKVKAALSNNEIKETDIDKLVYRSLFTRYLFYWVYKNAPAEKPNQQVDQALAKEVAAEGTVLLKNKDGLLPLKNSTVKSILLVGRLADKKNDGDVGSSGVKTKVITPLQAFKAYAKQHGITLYFSEDSSKISKLAPKVDAVLVLTGLNHLDEGEFISLDGSPKKDPYKLARGAFKKMGRAGDRYDLSLRASEIKLIRQVSALNKNTIVYLIGGSAIMMEEWKDSVPAIIYSGYDGMNGALTIPEVLFGEINPSGKLPFTIPSSREQLPDFPVLPLSINYDYYHGYTLLDKKLEDPAFPFGFGLSYTNFEIKDFTINEVEFSGKDTIELSLRVKNTGNKSGAEVVQAYVHFTSCKEVDRPVKLLKAFEKIFLLPAEEKPLTLKIPVSELSYYDVNTKTWKIEKNMYHIEIATSSRDLKATKFLFTVK